MSIYQNGREVLLDAPPHLPPLEPPTIRALPFPRTFGRTYVAHGSTVHVTPRGHWYRDGDAACRGCGAKLVGPSMAATDSVLDVWRCTHPGSQQDVAIALFESLQRPAPARMRSRRIRFVRSEVSA